MPTVAIASEFLDAFARIPRAQQRKVREFTEKFKANPKSAGHQLREDPRRQGRQGPHGADRPEVPGRHPAPRPGRRVRPRLGGQPRRGDGLGRQADASRSTRSPALPGLQRQRGRARPSPRRRRPGSRACSTPSTTTCCSPSACPQACCPPCGPCKTQDDLLALVKHLPAEAAEALTWLAEGIPPEEVRAAVTVTPAKETVNTEDLAHGPGEPRHQAPVRHHPVARRPDRRS